MVILQGGKSHRVLVWLLQAMRLKIHDSHLTCRVECKFLNVSEPVEEVERNKKMFPSLPLLPSELSVSVKENPNRKKIAECSSYKYIKGGYEFIGTPLFSEI